MSEKEIEVNAKKIEDAMKAILEGFEKRKFPFQERLYISAYLFANLLLDSEDEETHPRDTLRAGIELLSNALDDLESDDEEGEEGAAT